jgi:very-short-patch-repair endonuclease
MVWEKRQSRSEMAWALAARQHGVVTRRQLIDLGMSQRALEHRLMIGRLHRIDRGIYAVGRPALSQEGRWMAAVLACGRGAVLSNGSAAALWGIGPALSCIEVTIPIASPRRRAGVRIHRRPNLRPAHVTSHRGIPVTNPVRTLIDLARRLDQGPMERAINEADRLDLTSPEVLSAALDAYPSVLGVGRLKSIIGARTFRMTDSELERRFLPLVDAVRLPRPLTRQRVNGFRVDFFWPDLRLVVETDGLRYHRTPAQQARDRLRDQAHLTAGFTPLRFTHAQVRFEPGHVRETLAAVVSRLRVEARGGDRPLAPRRSP